MPYSKVRIVLWNNNPFVLDTDRQCDQMLEQKVPQFFQKMAKKFTVLVFTLTIVFLVKESKYRQISGLLLVDNFLPKTFQK